MKRKFSSTFPTFFVVDLRARNRTGLPCLTVFITCFFLFGFVFAHIVWFFHYASRSLCQKVRKKFSFIDLRGFHEILPCLNLQVGFDSSFSLFACLFPYNYSTVAVICSLVSSILLCFILLHRIGDQGEVRLFVFLYNGVCFAFVCSFHHL